MSHSISANIFGDFCQCIEDQITRVSNSIITRSSLSERDQTRKRRQLKTYPSSLPESSLQAIFDGLVEIEAGVQASIFNKIPRNENTPVSVFLQCLQDQINVLICDFLMQFDPRGLIKGYGDIGVYSNLSNIVVDFTALFDVYTSICGQDGSSLQASVNAALQAASLTTTGNFVIETATNGLGLTSSYKTLFDDSVSCVLNVFDIRDNISDHVILF